MDVLSDVMHETSPLLPDMNSNTMDSDFPSDVPIVEHAKRIDTVDLTLETPKAVESDSMMMEDHVPQSNYNGSDVDSIEYGMRERKNKRKKIIWFSNGKPNDFLSLVFFFLTKRFFLSFFSFSHFLRNRNR